MVILGAVLGAITFCIQGCEKWDGTQVSISMVMLALLLNLFLIPAVPGSGSEVRGNGEMYPLNGPSWSLFFEYIGNILYALFIRRFSTKQLTVLVILAAIGLASFAVCNLSGYGHLGVGWSLLDYNLLGGFLRLLFAFSAGLLMSRIFKPVKIRGAFWICSIAIAVVFMTLYVPLFFSRSLFTWVPPEKRQIKGLPEFANSWEIYPIPCTSFIILLCICIMPGCGVGKNSLSPIHGRWL